MKQTEHKTPPTVKISARVYLLSGLLATLIGVAVVFAVYQSSLMFRQASRPKPQRVLATPPSPTK